MNEFKQLKTTRKGQYGESLIKPILKAKGWHLYEPDKTDNTAHLVDFFGYKMKDKMELKAFEVKSRPAMLYYQATGIDNNKIEAYNFIHEQGIDLVFFFIDETSGNILTSNYKTMLTESIQQELLKTIFYPNKDILKKQRITLFTTRTMKCIGKITKEQQDTLKSLTNSNY